MRSFPGRNRGPYWADDVRGRAVLLHACCAPDATIVLEWWKPVVERLAVYFYNPNIYPPDEYSRRLEAMRVVAAHWEIELVEGQYEKDARRFEEAFAPFAGEPEGGKRCSLCFEIRLQEAARMACERGCEGLATTLTVSPQKNHRLINALGTRVAADLGVGYVPTNFKKRDGFKRCAEFSRALGIYRQNYCGCRYSLAGMSGKAQRTAR